MFKTIDYSSPIFLRMLKGTTARRKVFCSASFHCCKSLNERAPNIVDEVVISGKSYKKDEMTNIGPKIQSLTAKKLHQSPKHPLNHIKGRLVNFLQKKYVNNRGNPLFSIYEDLDCVVSIEQNFDELLVPKDHVSRSKSDSYYLNKSYMLRAHTSAHQKELLQAGLNSFAVIGDVYRRDEVKATHYPVFHQMEGLKLYTSKELLGDSSTGVLPLLTGAPLDERFHPEDTQTPQAAHTGPAVEALTARLKECLTEMVQTVFGDEIEYRWVDAHFPFTQPSWELEILHDGKWLEVLGCGVIHQQILSNAGVENRVGWAFGLGLERWAMKLYGIPDIRYFWKHDPAFRVQFDFEDCNTPVTFTCPVSNFPELVNDVSFWLPTTRDFNCNDFYDLIREVAGDLVEQVHQTDEFLHPKKQRTSHTYRIVYRSTSRELSQKDVKEIDDEIRAKVVEKYGVTLR